MLKAILEVCNENVPEHLAIVGGDYATPEGATWETLLDEFEPHQLLVTFNKDDTFAILDNCYQFANAAGFFKELYETGEVKDGESFNTIARNFDKCLANEGYCLI